MKRIIAGIVFIMLYLIVFFINYYAGTLRGDSYTLGGLVWVGVILIIFGARAKRKTKRELGNAKQE